MEESEVKYNIMSVLAKLQLEITGKGNSFILYNGTEQYYKRLRAAYLDIKNDNHNEYLYFCFISLCSSTLEYSLNFILADYCVENFGPRNYRTYLEEFIKIKFKNKLFLLPHIISEGKYKINEDSFSFKKLAELINLRNKILHNKEFLKEFDSGIKLEINGENIILPEGTDEIINFSFEVEDNIIDKIDKRLCLEIAEAIGDFKKFIMIPAVESRLTENTLLIKQDNFR